MQQIITPFTQLASFDITNMFSKILQPVCLPLIKSFLEEKSTKPDTIRENLNHTKLFYIL